LQPPIVSYDINVFLAFEEIAFLASPAFSSQERKSFLSMELKAWWSQGEQSS
jgi:hypothetical protein